MANRTRTTDAGEGQHFCCPSPIHALSDEERRIDAFHGGGHAKSRQGVAARLLIHRKTASLLALSLPGCSQAACDRPAQRRSIRESGRRGSNPREPAWKAGCHEIDARLL